MKKDNAKPASIPDSAAEPELPKVAEAAQFGQAQLHSEHLELPEAAEHGGDDGHRILAQEYQESAKLLGLSDTTEQGLVDLAQREGKPADDVISAYLHEQLPRHDFYEQPVILDMTA